VKAARKAKFEHRHSYDNATPSPAIRPDDGSAQRARQPRSWPHTRGLQFFTSMLRAQLRSFGRFAHIEQTHVLPERGPPQVGDYPDRVRSCHCINDEDDADLEVRAPASHADDKSARTTGMTPLAISSRSLTA
jgi:hypothetical protein